MPVCFHSRGEGEGFADSAHIRAASSEVALVAFGFAAPVPRVADIRVADIQVADILVAGTGVAGTGVADIEVEPAEQDGQQEVKAGNFQPQKLEHQRHATEDLPPSRQQSLGSAAMCRQGDEYHGQDHHRHQLLLDVLRPE